MATGAGMQKPVFASSYVMLRNSFVIVSSWETHGMSLVND